MHIYIIVAQNPQRIIGYRGKLPWHVPADLKFFKQTTWGHYVLMGRKTFEHLPHALPERHMLVLTRKKDYQPPFPATPVASLKEAFAAVPQNETLFIAGGSELYVQAMPFAEKIYATEIQVDCKGDAFFPVIDPHDWKRTHQEHHKSDEHNPYPYTFQVFERKK